MSKYQGRYDPLQMLKNVYANKKYKTKLKGKDICFDKQARINIKTETPWMSPQTHKKYNLGSLWLFMEHHIKNIPTSAQYLQKVSEYELEAVNIADKDQTIKYFTGEINQSPYLNQQLKLAISQTRKRDHPAGGFEQIQEGLVKKIKGQNNVKFELQVIDYLMAFQRSTNSKSRCMMYQGRTFESILKKISDQQKSTQQVSASGVKYKIMNILQRKKLPIIIIPERTQLGNVTLGNIEQFLLHNHYDENLELSNSWASKTEFSKELRGKLITFEVTNRPNLLMEKDWDNVVAIFVQGRENQFDQWPRTTPKRVFEQIPGFFVRYGKTSVKYSQQWKVKNLVIQKNTRYGDKQIVNMIWADIENYIFQKQ